MTHSLEHQILVQLSRFPELLFELSQTYRLSLLAHYLFDLCRLYGEYYNDVTILKAEGKTKNARLGLTLAVQQVLQNGLKIMGIEFIDEM